MDRDFSTNKNEFVKALSSIKFIDKYSLCDWHVLPAICVMQSPRLQMQTMQIYLMFTNSVFRRNDLCEYEQMSVRNETNKSYNHRMSMDCINAACGILLWSI